MIFYRSIALAIGATGDLSWQREYGEKAHLLEDWRNVAPKNFGDVKIQKIHTPDFLTAKSL